MDVAKELPKLRIYARVFTRNHTVADDRVAYALEQVIEMVQGGLKSDQVFAGLLKAIRQSFSEEHTRNLSKAYADTSLEAENIKEIRLHDKTEDLLYSLPLVEREVLVLMDLLQFPEEVVQTVLNQTPDELNILHAKASADLSVAIGTS